MEWNGMELLQSNVHFQSRYRPPPNCRPGRGLRRAKGPHHGVKGPHMVVKGLTGRFKGRARQRTAQVKDPPTEMNLRKMLECDN